jgi:hypothetical protein
VISRAAVKAAHDGDRHRTQKTSVRRHRFGDASAAGYTLLFVSQFDGSLDKYFDDFVLNGKENLLKQ